MAKKLDTMPPPTVGQGHRTSAWKKYADGGIWEVHVYDDLNYSRSPIELSVSEQDAYDRAAQNKAQNSARRWGTNNGYHVLARLQQRDRVVVMFTPDNRSPVVS